MHALTSFEPPFLIAGSCALEDEATAREIAQRLKAIKENLGIPVVFKGSYKKANRTREKSYHGLGLKKGLELLALVRREYGLPVTSDVHEVAEVEQAAGVLDVIQIPALLCKNTDLLHAVGDTGKPGNIKKGQFVTAEDVGFSIEKITSRGNTQIWVTERGTLFGYGEIIVDFRSIGTLKKFGFPVIFDTTHSVRHTARRSEAPNGGTPEAISLLTRCAAAAGADGLFAETHPSPKVALCDSIVSYPLSDLRELVRSFKEIHGFVKRME